MSAARVSVVATTNGKYALFGGGSNADGYSNRVDIWDSEAFQWLPWTTLSQGREELAVTSVGNYVLFGGGGIGTAYSNVVDIWVNAALEPICLECKCFSLLN